MLAHGSLLAVALALAVKTGGEPVVSGSEHVIEGDFGGSDSGVTPGVPGPPSARPPAWRNLKPIDAERVLRDYRATLTPSSIGSADVANRPVAPRPTSRARAVETRSTTSQGGTPGHVGIVAVRVDSPTGGLGPGPERGRIPGGGPGDPGAEITWAGAVRSAFVAAYLPRVRALGAEMVADTDKGEVRVGVSAAGLVSFAGWESEPSSPAVADAVRAAIAAMPPVGAPPGGGSVIVRIPFAMRQE